MAYDIWYLSPTQKGLWVAQRHLHLRHFEYDLQNGRVGRKTFAQLDHARRAILAKPVAGRRLVVACLLEGRHYGRLFKAHFDKRINEVRVRGRIAMAVDAHNLH